MEQLKLPELLSGDWKNLLILTYGADIPFFEKSIWRALPAGCRNKIILADADQFLRSCQTYAENGLARYINQRYLVETISVPQSAHAKMILLTNSSRGRLLIGSGNLGISGYASGGELFTRYEYNDKSPDHLPAFLAAWEFMGEIINKGYVGVSALQYIQHMHKQTPWLFQSAKSDFKPVRHNLSKSFLVQLKEDVNNEAVEELWVLSPFYDEKANALREMLKTLAPKKIKILVQSGRTSLDLQALDRVLSEFSGKKQVHTFKRAFGNLPTS